MTKTRVTAYAICQAAGWTAWAAANLFFFAISTVGVTARSVGAAVFGSALGLAVSHAYRGFVRARRWGSLRLAALAPRVIAASVAQAAVMVAAISVMGRATAAPGAAPIDARPLAMFLFNFSVVFLAWSLLYFGVHWFERSRRTDRAELRFLRAQLNPHFLFNALNGIRALIAEDPARAQVAVTRLASLLRAALGAANADTVPLERELAVVDDYLAIEALRFEERLAVAVDVAPDALAAPVPSMLVLTLVENGIKHGIAKSPAGGEIAVRARVAGGALEVAVSNTSAGEGDGAPGHGIGIANAVERLELLFGPHAELRLDRSARDRTTAAVRIPLG